MRTFDSQPAPLPDPIELGIRLAGLRLADAAVHQRVAAMNHESFRRRPDRVATQRLAEEHYAYARFLMKIDSDWLLLDRKTISVRPEYLFPEAGLGFEPKDMHWLPLPPPDATVPAYLHEHVV